MDILAEIKVEGAGSTASIARVIGRLIRDGLLASGERLPTVRVMAEALGLSQTAVSLAFQQLTTQGLIRSRGRAGTFVLGDAQSVWAPAHAMALRGSQVPHRQRPTALLDLSRGTPDPALLPSLTSALARVGRLAQATSYHEEPVLPALRDHLTATWPIQPEALTVVDGAMDGVYRILESIRHYGDRVIVEDPGYPVVLDILDRFGLEPVPVALDACGIIPASLAAALARGPAAIIMQPRAHNPTGISMTASRRDELAFVIGAADPMARVLIVEDDHSALVAQSSLQSFSELLPAQTVHVRGFSKSHGPEMRIAAVGGPSRVIRAIEVGRMLGPGWTSRIKQQLLFELLIDPEAIAQVEAARAAYAQRQLAFASALARHNIAVRPGDGINCWVPAPDERSASVALVAQGIRVAEGRAFYVHGGPGHLRVTICAVTRDPCEQARKVARAIDNPPEARPFPESAAP
jgi:DNA-binding transcriptional MocR family regulator